MLNCKIRFTRDWLGMKVSAGDNATFVHGILYYPDGYFSKRVYDSIDEFRKSNVDAKFEVIEMEGKPVEIEDHPAFKNDAQKLFPICYALGGKDNPLKIGEKFQLLGYDSDQTLFIQPDGKLYITLCKNGPAHVASDSLCDALNHPEKIIRRPQFSEDEKALMRLYMGIGFSWIARDQTNEIVAYPRQPRRGDDAFEPIGTDTYLNLPEKFLSQITWKNSPFDSAAYLESEANHAAD